MSISDLAALLVGFLYSSGCHGRAMRTGSTLPRLTMLKTSRTAPERLIILPVSVSPSTSTSTEPNSVMVRFISGIVPLRLMLAPALPATMATDPWWGWMPALLR